MLMKPMINAKAAPPSLLPWLRYQQSLTERLQGMSGDASLEVLAERWETADRWDQTMLHLGPGRIFHREIQMLAWGEPCWYARTIIPEQTFDADKPRFHRLKHESLGALIFNDAKVKRAWMTHYPIGPKSLEYLWLTKAMHGDAAELWMRLSMFVLNEHLPFFLAEILLPGLARYSN